MTIDNFTLKFNGHDLLVNGKSINVEKSLPLLDDVKNLEKSINFSFNVFILGTY